MPTSKSFDIFDSESIVRGSRPPLTMFKDPITATSIHATLRKFLIFNFNPGMTWCI